MAKKGMNLNFAVDMLYQEATQEDSKYSQNQKEGAYQVLKENIIIIDLLTKIIKKEKEYCKNNNIRINCDSHWLNDGEKEAFESWFDQI